MELRGRVNMRKSLNRKALSSFPLLTWNEHKNEFKRELKAYRSLQSVIIYSWRKITLGNKPHTAGLHLSFRSTVSSNALSPFVDGIASYPRYR